MEKYIGFYRVKGMTPEEILAKFVGCSMPFQLDPTLIGSIYRGLKYELNHADKSYVDIILDPDIPIRLLEPNSRNLKKSLASLEKIIEGKLILVKSLKS